MSIYTYETGFFWEDPLGGETTQRYLREETAVGLEESIRLEMEFQRRHYEVGRELNLNYKALVTTTKDTQAVRYLRNTAYWVGGERGQRIGRERGKRMIKEAYEFAELSLAQYEPLFADGEDSEGDV